MAGRSPGPNAQAARRGAESMKAPTTLVTAMDVTKASNGGMKPGVANSRCACREFMMVKEAG